MIFSTRMKKKTKKVVLLFLCLFTIFLTYCYFESRWLKTTNLIIESGDIPTSFDGKRIVFISDVHHGRYFSRERVAQLVDTINNLKPDIIILGGDYVYMDPAYVYSFFDEVSKLESKYGIYGVMGNHDYWVGESQTRKMMQQNKIKNCDNKSYWLKIGKDSIKIGGLDDITQGVQIPDSTIYDVKKNDFCILISHRPDNIPILKTDRVDLTLSGHTHGGQITLFGLWAPLLPEINNNNFKIFPVGIQQKYRYGLIKSNGIQSYITSGVGTLTPLRFFCRPEIVVFKLKKIKSDKAL